MFKKIITSITLIAFLTSVCFAQEAKIVTLDEGQPAPFSGSLLNVAASAKILAESESCIDKCELRLKKLNDTKNADCTLAVEKLKIANDFEISVYKSQNNFLKSQIDLSVNQLKKKTVSSEWYFVGGFLIGTLTAVLVTYSLAGVID